MVWWLRFHTPNAGGVGSGWGTGIRHAVGFGQKVKKNICWGMTSASWDYGLNGVSTAPSPLSTTPTSQTFKAQLEKAIRPVSPLLCLRRDSGKNRSDMETKVWVRLHVFSLHKCPETLQAGYMGCTGVPLQACVEQTIASFWSRPQLSQMYSEGQVLNPGLESESPGAPT